MRILGIETSSRRGSVALLEDGRVVGSAEHTRQNEHAERMLPLIEGLLAEAAWDKRTLTRVAVCVGPGSFTGLRIGIALADGMGLGLGIDVVGVPSLLAMAAAVPTEIDAIRCALLDARRDEVFVAAYAPDGAVVEAAHAVARAAAGSEVARIAGGRSVVVVGEVAAELGLDPVHRSNETDLPHAVSVARIGASAPVPTEPVQPVYVRGPNATLPDLPPSPLDNPVRG